MNVTTLQPPANRRRAQNAPRSGGRTAAHEDFQVDGTTALQPKRRVQEAHETAAREAPRQRPERREEPTRLTVAPPAPVTAPRAPFVSLVLVLVLAGVIGILVLNTKIAENAFKLDELRNAQVKLDHDEQRLKSDIAEQESPVNVAARGAQLGLVPSRTPAFLLLPDGTKLEMPGPAGRK
jgi:hypothetical protein